MPSWQSHHTLLVFVDSYHIISHCLVSSTFMFPHKWIPPTPSVMSVLTLWSSSSIWISFQAPEHLTDNLLSQVKYQRYPEEKYGVPTPGRVNPFCTAPKLEPGTKKLHSWTPYLYKISKLFEGLDPESEHFLKLGPTCLTCLALVLRSWLHSCG